MFTAIASMPLSLKDEYRAHSRTGFKMKAPGLSDIQNSRTYMHTIVITDIAVACEVVKSAEDHKNDGC
jgi:hypothetical protein